jgi:aldehyde dehydrogenase (NAD+)
MEKDINDAVKADLGRGAFITWFTEVLGLNKQIDHAIENLKKWMAPISVDTPMLVGPGCSKLLAEPLGTVLILGSWNFPLFTTLGPLIDVIAAGNCSIIKGSEFSLNTSRKMK